MGDPIPSHLEKMGRELKCPICLSLLSSAVSLHCNHTFCNACITKSMKSGSHCPVCKVPYTRREIRAAPHMDNLVTIYKNMEVASGVNIFVTQNQPPNRPSDDEKKDQTDHNCIGQVVESLLHEKADNKSKRKIDASNGARCKAKRSDPISVKPAFPTKKRVQVPHHLSTPSPKQESRSQKIIEDVSKSSTVLKDSYAVKANRETLLSPFFWLREDDGDRSTQNTNEDQMFYVTPPELPSFSDLKYSDDEGYAGEKVHRNSDAIHLLDSEMFDWTQRACSPELYSSPVKLQQIPSVDQTEGQTGSASLDTNIGTSCEISEECMVEPRALTDVPSKRTKSMKAGKQKFRKTKEANQEKKTTRNAGHISTHQVNQKQNLAGVCDAFVSEKNREINKNSSLHVYANELDPEDGSADSIRAITLHLCNTNNVKKVPANGDDKQRAEDRNSNYENNLRECHGQHQNGSRGSRSKTHKLNSVDIAVIEEVPGVDIEDTHYIGDNSVRCTGETPPNLRLKTFKHSGKKPGVSNNAQSKNGLAEDHQQGFEVALSKEVTGKVQGSFNTGLSDDLSTIKGLQVADGVSLRTCDLDASKIRCEFCLSSEESEVSGEMVHYYDGRAVAQDYNAGSKVIHSHRNCLEWAPNVYFENDTAINLEAELSRSRRIKCSCCGLRGAALGCYEKSCRKSFHVPCAKLVSKCRWDAENFVMLCPLHASLRLPIENLETPGRRIKPTQKRRSPSQQNQSAPNHNICLPQKWDSCGSFKKLVLSCSALRFEEREVVSEFEELSGVAVLKKWDSSITHVIASTDENGACRRTLKILRGTLEGKWILNTEWVKACMKAMKPVDEAQYEVAVDVYGIRDGPQFGRLRLLNKEPKLFHGFKFYMMGDFDPSYKGYLQELLIAAGGTILHRKPIVGEQEALLSDSSVLSALIVYSLELPSNRDSLSKELMLSQRQSAAQALASSTGSKAVSNTWVLNSIAASKLQSFD